MNARKPATAALAAALLFLATLAPAATEPLTLEQRIEQRLAKLETEVAALRQENRQLRAEIATRAIANTTDEAPAPDVASARTTSPAAPAPDASTPLAAIIKPGGNTEWLSVGGFIQAQAETGDAPDTRFTSASAGKASNNRFYLRRARIVLGGHFAENFDIRVTAEMAGSLSSSGGMRGQLADGFISWTKYPALNATVGQFKTTYGHEFLYNDLTLYAIEHALVTDVLTLGRQVGAHVSGSLLDKRLSYTAGLFNGNGVNNSANDNNRFLYLGRVTAVPLKTQLASTGWNLRWTFGANAYRSDDATITLPDSDTIIPSFAGRRTGYGLDTQLAVGPLEFWFEYLNTRFTPDIPVPGAGIVKTNADGWYLQAAWNIVPKKWQAFARYDTFDPDTRLADNTTDTWTLGVNYLIKGDDLKLLLNYMTSDPRFRASNNQSEDRANRLLMRLQAAF